MTITFFILALLMGLMCLSMKVTVKNRPVTEFLGSLIMKLSGLYVIFYSGVYLSKQFGWL